MKLEGGRYDGMIFDPLGRNVVQQFVAPFAPLPRVLYLGRPDFVEWAEAAARDRHFCRDEENALVFAATTASPLPYESRLCRDASLDALPQAWEPYVRCTDGGWRAPALAGVRSLI